MRRIFVTGIGTDVGKTVVSAILAEAMHADYWKPVQSGSDQGTDCTTVRSLISNTKSICHTESYCLKAPLAPHDAAKREGIEIQPEKIKIPSTENSIVIEGAGGIFVPLNDNYFVMDLIQQLKAEVLLVSKNYLGSINHTLLTIEALSSRGIKVIGIVFNGNPYPEGESIILAQSKLPLIGRVFQENKIDASVILKYAGEFTIPK
jgi:dethiobiotin synthetase